LVDASGRRIEWLTEEQGRRMLKSQTAEAVFTRKGRLKVLRTVSYQKLIASGSPASHTTYSHNSETPTNPRGVWTFTRLR
jgi:hypothetical protein